MIHGYVTLRRQLRDFIWTLGLQWQDVYLRYEVDDDGRTVHNSERAELSFRFKDKFVELVIFAPSEDRDHKPDGKNVLPNGKVAARIDGRVISGPIDQETWAKIRVAINE